MFIRIALKIFVCVVFLLLLPSNILAQQTPSNGPTGITFNAAGDGSMIFTETQSNKIGKISNSGYLIEHAVPTFNSRPTGISLNSGWFTETQGNKIGKINSVDGTIVEYDIPTPNSGPTGIAFNPGDPNGYNIWFTETQANKIGKVKTGCVSCDGVALGTIIEYDIPTPNSGPTGIAFNGGDPNGYYMWFTETQGNKIGSINSAGTIIEYDIPTPNSGPTGIAFNYGDDYGYNIWFTETQGNKLGKVKIDCPLCDGVAFGTIIEYDIPTPNSGPTGIAFNPGDPNEYDIWFTESQANKIGKFKGGTGTDYGTIIEYDIPTPNSGPTGIAFNSGSSGMYNMWFTETQGNKIGKINNVDGTIIEYALPIPDYINPNVGAISLSVNPVIVNTSITASTAFTDPEQVHDVPYSVEWDWGDGSVESPYLVNTPGLLSRDHTYTSAGVYEIKLTVTDSVGEVGTSAFQYLSVYNPTPEGLFSAGQKYTSPVGAYPQNPNATGNVMFGLSYKYQGDVSVGNRQFSMDFKNADFRFNATAISSLVITNGVGTLRGTGLITGSPGTYSFLVVGKEGTGAIRIQIKDTQGNTIYDTQPGAIDTADPTTVVTGNILAH